jgi:hypothetical protein
VLLLGIIIFAALTIIRQAGGADDTTEPDALADPTTASPQDDSSAAGPTVNEEDLLHPEGSVDGFRYEQLGDVWYLISDTDGPKEFTETRSAGFAQTPDGAALAAYHIYRRIDPSTNPDGWEQTVTEQIRGDGQEPMMHIYQAIADNDQPNTVAGTWTCYGWSTTSFNPLEAQIDLHSYRMKDGHESFLKMPMRLVWEDDDWRLVPPDAGTYAGMGEFISLSADPPEVNLIEMFE